MKLYAVYVKGSFIEYFDTLYEARHFVAHCQHVLYVIDNYQPGLFEIKEEEV